MKNYNLYKEMDNMRKKNMKHKTNNQNNLIRIKQNHLIQRDHNQNRKNQALKINIWSIKSLKN